MLEIINLSERKPNLLEITNKKNFLLIELREIINTMVKKKVIFLKKK